MPLLNLIASDPMHQFRIIELIPIHVGGFTLSFTNSSLFMLLAVSSLCLLLGTVASHAQIRPGRMQMIVESTYQFVAGIVRDGMGNEGMRFFPFVFSLFLFILASNMIGMFPYFFTTTSHIIVNFALAMLVMAVLILYGFWRNGLKFLKIFAPSGIPILIMPLIILIEIISFISRPVSLSLRLFANMLAGHIMLKVFAGFVITLASAGGLLALAAPLPLAMTIALTALEFLVSFLQAYVFAVLTCIYLNDALHPGH